MSLGSFQASLVERFGKAAGRLLDLYPDFAPNAWMEVQTWQYDDGFAAYMIGGPRKAGIEIREPIH